MKKLLTLTACMFLAAASFAQNKTLIIDAGHGGADAGAIAPTGAAEKNYTLQLALALKKAATAAGYQVVMTREDDSYPGLNDRAALRDRHQGSQAYFISLHAEASLSDTARGIVISFDEKTAGISASWRNARRKR